MKPRITFAHLYALGLALFCIFVLSGNSLFAQEQPKKRPLVIDDLFKIKRVGSPEISPDNKWVAYTVSSTDLEKDKSENRIWMVSTDGGEPLPMTAKGYSASRPAWSPDGRYLSFLAARDEEKTQVWALDRRGGEAQPLTEVPQGVSSYEWSPDGKKLLLILRDPKPEDLEKEKDKKKPEKPEPWVIDRLQFKRDRSGYLDTRYSHLYTLTLGEKKPVQITSGGTDDSQPAWSPDGKQIAFVSNRTNNPDGNHNTDIFIVSAANTDKGQTLFQVTKNPGADRSPAWSPDGKHLTYVTTIEPDIIWYATNHLAVISAQGGEPRILTQSLDRNVSSPRFSPDGKSIYFLLEDSAERHLARIESLIFPAKSLFWMRTNFDSSRTQTIHSWLDWCSQRWKTSNSKVKMAQRSKDFSLSLPILIPLSDIPRSSVSTAAP
jgi:Tol biopolymer transport system component